MILRSTNSGCPSVRAAPLGGLRLLQGLLLLLVLSPPGVAGVVEQLYDAEVDWDGQDRRAAFSAALGEVIVRVTGDRGSLREAAVAELMAKPDGYVQQFRPGDAGDTLWVSFDGAAVTQALRAIGQPVWGEERPTTLLWLAVDQGSGRRGVLGADPDRDDAVMAALRTRVEDTARARGLPIVFPLLDAEDRAALSFADLWGGFDEAIEGASGRYATDAVLAGRVSLSEPDRGRWTLYSGSAPMRWVGDTADGIERTADHYAAIFAVSGAGAAARDLAVRIHGVRDVAGYARALSHLESLTAVREVSVEQMEGDRLTLRLAVNGSPASLDQALALGSVLRPLEAETPVVASGLPVDGSEAVPDREYRLLP
jgi:hypothetical protein